MNLIIRNSVVFFVVFVILAHGSAQGQTNLQKVRKEIEELKSELSQREKRQRSFLDQVEDLDREIGLRRKLLHELEKERNKNEEGIRNTENRLRTANRSYIKLKELVSRRIVIMYKQGRMKDWEILLTMHSLNQVMVWVKYSKRIIENDRRNLQLLLEKETEIRSQRQQLQTELNHQKRLIGEKTRETRELEVKKQSREKLITSLRKDIQSLTEKLQRTQRVYKEIEGYISREEQKRKAAIPKRVISAFATLKGKLSWPVKGKVVSKYGRRRHPTLKTWTENLGVDIETKEKDAVRAVDQGGVNWVIWRRGMGNIVLVDHGGGYYTVYAYLDVVLVNIGDELDKGDVIGYVGDRQSLNGPTLHFEVWNGTTHYDPMTWLQ